MFLPCRDLLHLLSEILLRLLIIYHILALFEIIWWSGFGRFWGRLRKCGFVVFRDWGFWDFHLPIRKFVLRGGDVARLSGSCARCGVEWLIQPHYLCWLLQQIAVKVYESSAFFNTLIMWHRLKISLLKINIVVLLLKKIWIIACDSILNLTLLTRLCLWERNLWNHLTTMLFIALPGLSTL